MRILPLAADSLGARSMATFVETRDCKILIDPGVELGPLRFGLPPHPLEYQKREEFWRRIKRYSKKADILTVSHYHYDHHNPDEPEIFACKESFLKHPKENINRSQRSRASFFLKGLKDLPDNVEFSDGKEFEFGGTLLRFSEAVTHGPSKKLGYVVQISISEGKETFLHTSDIQGPCTKSQTQFILGEDPNIIFCDGPLSYMMQIYGKKALKRTQRNVSRILRDTRVKKFVFDHHFLRELEWRKRIPKIFKVAEECGVDILTAAEFSGKKNNMLEARRKQLYDEGK